VEINNNMHSTYIRCDFGGDAIYSRFGGLTLVVRDFPFTLAK